MRAAGNAEMNTDSCKTDQHPQGKNQLLSRGHNSLAVFYGYKICIIVSFQQLIELLSSSGQNDSLKIEYT